MIERKELFNSPDMDNLLSMINALMEVLPGIFGNFHFYICSLFKM